MLRTGLSAAGGEGERSNGLLDCLRPLPLFRGDGERETDMSLRFNGLSTLRLRLLLRLLERLRLLPLVSRAGRRRGGV